MNNTPHAHAWTYDGIGFAIADGSGTGADCKHHLDGSATVDSTLGGDLNYDRDDITGCDRFIISPGGTWAGAWSSIIVYKGVVSNAGIARAYKFLKTRQGL